MKYEITVNEERGMGMARFWGTRISGPYWPLKILAPAGGSELACFSRMILRHQIQKGGGQKNT